MKTTFLCKMAIVDGGKMMLHVKYQEGRMIEDEKEIYIRRREMTLRGRWDGMGWVDHTELEFRNTYSCQCETGDGNQMQQIPETRGPTLTFCRLALVADSSLLRRNA